MTWPRKQEGWLSPTERASVSAISLTHILESLAYAPVQWDNRSKCHMDGKRIQCLSNTYSMHHNTHLSSINRLRAIARYWSEIATFSYPLHLKPPFGVFPLEYRGKSLVLRKLKSCAIR